MRDMRCYFTTASGEFLQNAIYDRFVIIWAERVQRYFLFSASSRSPRPWVQVPSLQKWTDCNRISLKMTLADSRGAIFSHKKYIGWIFYKPRFIFAPSGVNFLSLRPVFWKSWIGHWPIVMLLTSRSFASPGTCDQNRTHAAERF